VPNKVDSKGNTINEVHLPRGQVDPKPEAKRVGEGKALGYST